mgnify:CR=1 FL=1
MNVYTQNHFLKGKVTDEDGKKMPGATIVEVDANDRIINGTMADLDGNYSISLSSSNTTVKFSFVGYKSVEKQIAGESELNVKLIPETRSIDEVVVTGSKMSSSLTNVAERDKTGSSVTVDMSKIKSSSVTSVGDALQGQVAGLDIMGGGSPGGGSNIVIRGLGSLAGSEPLIVVDGIIQQVSTSDVDLGSADSEDIGQLVSIAPEDIKEVRVLKDAAETAKWGSKGANGVIEIITLSGKRGKTKFDINYKKSFQVEAPTIPMLNGDEYQSMQLEMWHNARGVFDVPSEIANDKDWFNYYNYAQNTDWLGEITRVGQVDDFGFRFSGGGDKTTYYSSINYQNNKGTVLNTGNRRFSGRVNLDYRISTKLRLNTQIVYTNIYKDDNWKRNRRDNIRRNAYTKSPNMAIYEFDEFGSQTDNFFNPVRSYQGDGVRYYNPVAMANLSDNDRANNKFQTNFNLNYRPTDWFRLRQMVSFQFDNTKSKQFLPYTAIGTRWLDNENNSATEANRSGVLLSTRTTAFLTLITNPTHYLSGTLMWETSSSNSEYIRTSSSNGASVVITDPSGNAIKGGIRSSYSQVNDVGALAQVLYKLFDKHIFQASARADANSKFGATYRWGVFPSVSYAWRFSDEPFIKSLGVFDDSKIRVSWGRTGNSGGVGAYDRHGFFADAHVSGRGSSYLTMPTLIPTRPELERLKWETSEQINIGCDISMFSNRFNFSLEWYQKETQDILWRNYDIPSASGFDELERYNEGGIMNQGWEFSTRATAIRNNEFSLSFNFNVFNNRNSFTKFPPNLITEQNTDLSNNEFPVKAEIGTPVGSFFGLRYEGVYPTSADAMARNADGSIKYDSKGNPIPMNFKGIYQFEGGDAKYKDINYDGIIDINDVVYLGDSNPDFAGGFGFNTRYREFQVNANFLYRAGFQIVNEIAMETESMNNKNNQSTAVLHRWRKPGQDFEGILPRAYLDNPANNLGSDRYVENGDFVRLNSVSVSYDFGKTSFFKELKLDDFKVTFIGRKLFTLTNYSGQDPEISNRVKDPFWFGTDNGEVPPPIVYAINFDIGF